VAKAADARIAVTIAGVVFAGRADRIMPNGADAPGKVLPSSCVPMKVLTGVASSGAAPCAAGSMNAASNVLRLTKREWENMNMVTAPSLR
jgi:hypothetical protein